MKEIKLTKDQFSLVDDWWYEYLMQWEWKAYWSINSRSFYAVRWEGSSRRKTKKTIWMHRVVMKTPEGMECDHIHHKTLDNRESELRNVTTTQNQMNKRVQINNKLGVRGVFAYGDNGKYRAQLQFQGSFVLDKTFNTFDEAVKARKEAEQKYFGEFAYQDDMS